MSITYSGGIITVTGGSDSVPNTFDDIYNADVSGGWGVVTKQGSTAYRFTAPIVVGDGTTASYLYDTNKYVEITTVQSTYKVYLNGAALHVRANGFLKLGVVSDAGSKTTKNGCIVFSSIGTTGREAISGTAGSSIKLYSTTVKTSVYGYVWFRYGDASSVFDVWNSKIECDLLESEKTSGSFLSDIYNTTVNSNEIANAIGFRCYGDSDKISVFNADLGAVGSIKNAGPNTVRNLYARNNNQIYDASGVPATDDMFFIDADSDTWAMSFRGTCLNTVYRQWSHNFTSNAGTSSLRFALYDTNGTEAFNEVTDGSGVLAEQIVTEGYFEDATGNTLQDLKPHTLRIRKYGRRFLEQTRQVTSKVIEGVSDAANPFVVASEAAALAYTGITISGSGKTITLSSAHTLQEVYDYAQAWAAQSGNMQYEEPLSSIDGSTFTMPTGWTFIPAGYLTYGSQSLAGGTIQLGAAGTYAPKLGTITIDFTAASGTYALGGGSYSGTITLVNTGGGSLTVELPSGTSYVNTGPNITVSTPLEYQGITFSGVIDGSQVKIFTTGTQTELYSATAAPYSFSQLYSTDITVDYTVMKTGQTPIRVTGVVLGNAVQTVTVQQSEDRSYQASSGLTYGTNTSANTGTNEFDLTTATTVQNFHSHMIEEWIAQATLKNTEYPIVPNGSNSFTLKNGWEFTSGSLPYLSRDGLRYTDSGVDTACWVAILSIGEATGLTAEYQQVEGAAPTDAAASGPVDQLIQIYGDASHGNFDYTDYLVIKYQVNGYNQASTDVVATYGTLADELYVVALEPAAIADFTTGDPGITGVTITNHGASPVTWNAKDFSVTITDTGSNTGEDIERWINYNLSLDATFQGDDPFNYPDMVYLNGDKYETIRGTFIGSAGATLKGVRVIDGSGDPHPYFNRFMADDGTYYVPPVSVTVSAASLIDGTRVQIYNVTQDTEIDNSLVSGGGGYSYTDLFGTGQVFEDGDVIRLRATYVSGSSAAKKELSNTGAITASGLSFLDAQVDDTVYTTWAIDGSGVTEFSADFPNVQVDIDDPDGGTTKKRLGAWLKYIVTTADGIRNFFGTLSTANPADMMINETIVDLQLDNVAVGELIFTDTDVRLYRSDKSQIIATGSGSIFLDYEGVPFVVETGVSGLTAGESAKLDDISGIKAKTDSLTFTQSGNVDANIQYVNDVQVSGTGATGDEWGPV